MEDLSFRIQSLMLCLSLTSLLTHIAPGLAKIYPIAKTQFGPIQPAQLACIECPL